MPGFDRTGPNGEGAKTGRGLGKCNPNSRDTGDNVSTGRGLGRGLRRGAPKGRGQGRGMGRGKW